MPLPGNQGTLGSINAGILNLRKRGSASRFASSGREEGSYLLKRKLVKS